MKVQDPTPERLGPYRLIRRLGEGGMGVVYLASDSTGLPVAVKALHPGLAPEENARRRLAREVETMRRVRSPYVAEVIDSDLAADQPYIVTRYVPGLTLDAVVTAGGPLTRQALARLACGLAQALAAVHAAGVVHRDLKPGNVMISDGEPVVIDFGIAHLPDTTRLTMTGMFMGTPGYLAPEVIEGKDSGPASDVHSLAATLAFAATGRPPYGSGTFEAIFYRIMHGQPDLDTLPAPLRPVILAALARDPVQRPAAAQFAEQLAALDPECLVPSTSLRGALPVGGLASDGPAALGLPWTVTDVPGGQPLRHSTKPLGAVGPEDVRDLLPPVNYAADGHAAAAANGGLAPAVPGGGLLGGVVPGNAGAGVLAGPAGPAGPAGRGMPAGYAIPANGAGSAAPGVILRGGVPSDGQSGASRALTVSAWSPLVFAFVVMAAAVAVIAPIAGTAIALAVLIGLRAVTTTGRQLAKRRSAAGSRGSDAVVAAALFPLAALRSLAGMVLLSPVALLGFCVAAAITIVIVPVHPLPQAVAFGAGALVALVGLGPGSAGSRTALASMFSSIGRTPARMAIAYLGMLALAAWAGLSAWSQSGTAAYWPVNSLHDQLVHVPTLRTMVTDVRQNLLRLARQFGL